MQGRRHGLGTVQDGGHFLDLVGLVWVDFESIAGDDVRQELGPGGEKVGLLPRAAGFGVAEDEDGEDGAAFVLVLLGGVAVDNDIINEGLATPFDEVSGRLVDAHLMRVRHVAESLRHVGPFKSPNGILIAVFSLSALVKKALIRSILAPEACLSRHPKNNVREREWRAVFDSVQVDSPVIFDPVRINVTLSLGYDKRGRSVGRASAPLIRAESVIDR